MDIPDILSASAWAEAAEETRTGEWCLTGWGIRDGRLRLELGMPLQLLGPPLLPLLLPPPPPPLLWFLWYSIGDVKAAVGARGRRSGERGQEREQEQFKTDMSTGKKGSAVQIHFLSSGKMPQTSSHFSVSNLHDLLYLPILKIKSLKLRRNIFL